MEMSNESNVNTDNKGILLCKFGCNTQIKFDNQVVGKNGKLIPLNSDGSIHNCPNRNHSIDEKNITHSDNKNKRCFKCNRPIHFSSEHIDKSTGKAIPLDPLTNNYHECDQDEVNSYKDTDEYRKRIEEWKSTRENSQNSKEISNRVLGSISQIINDDTKNSNNNSKTSEMLNKIQTAIDHLTADIADIKNTVKKENQGNPNKPPQTESEPASSDQPAPMDDTRSSLETDPNDERFR